MIAPADQLKIQPEESSANSQGLIRDYQQPFSEGVGKGKYFYGMTRKSICILETPKGMELCKIK